MNDRRSTPVRLLLSVTRLWLPVGIALGGAVCIALGHGRTSLAAAGVVLLGAALIVWMINWLFRLSIESNHDREREEDARRYFDVHGRWPGEEDE
jgi:hypothetical protein